MEIHIYDQLEEYFGLEGKVHKTISVKEIIKHSGLYSGLTLSVKEIITPYTDNWKDCELEIHRGSRPGWFIIEGILDERSNRQWLVSKQSYIGLR